MADIYEPLTQQVGITGPQQAPGFKPAQAYDPSQQILADKGVEEFAAFSKTIMEAITERAKEINKSEYLAGLTGLVEGKTAVDPQILQQSQQGQQELAAGVTAEMATAGQIAQQDPVAAEVYYNRTPAVSGWRAYGQAVREAQVAAAESEIFLEDFTTSTDEANAVTVTLPDGSTKKILPAAIETPEELAAVLAAASTALINQKGLDRFNPAILAEHVIPRLTDARTVVQGRRLRELQANIKQAKTDELDTYASRMIPSITTPEQAAALTQTLFDGLFVNTRDRRLANEMGQRILFSSLEALARTQPETAKTVLELLAQANISAKNEKLGTLGDRFEADFDRMRGLISRQQEEAELKFQEDIKAKYEGILGQFTLIQQTGSLQEVQRAYDETIKVLEDLSDDSAEDRGAAGAALATLRANSRNYSVVNEGLIERYVDDPVELDSLLKGGYITQETFNKKMMAVEPSDENARIGSIRSQLLANFTQQFAEKLATLKGLAGEPTEGMRALVGPWAAALTDEVLNYVRAQNNTERARSGRGLTTANMVTTALTEGGRMINENSRYRLQLNAYGQPVPFIHTAGQTPSTVRLENGQTVGQLQQRALNRLPQSIPITRNTVLPPDLVQDSIRALREGGQIDPRVRVAAAAANVNPMELLRVEGSRLPGFNPADLNTSQAQQRFNENFSLNPSAARILANPRSTPAQLRQATEALELARTRRQLAASLSAPSTGAVGGEYGGPAFANLRNAIFQREGGAAGYNAANKGEPGDTPGGVPGLTNMTIRQVLQLYDTGGYNVLGGFQFKKGTLQILTRVAGVSLDEKFSPETQNRLFQSYFSQGANNRRRLSGYVSGQNNDLRGALDDLSLEFAVVRSMNGRGQYPGQPATIDAAVMLRQMREFNMRQQGAGGAAGTGSATVGPRVDMSARNISSIEIEVPGPRFQPGFDLYFNDKRFGAVLPGVVKEIRPNYGDYGNLLIVNSTDPATGEKVDVVYAHFDSIAVRVGQSISVGQYLGKQGKTGRVVDADSIASVDFYRPAPVGSTDNTPYRNWRQLVERLRSQIRSGKL